MKTNRVITEALCAGGKLHMFRSGGGLRVARIERVGALVGYGEHPHAGGALNHVAVDFRAGGRPYAKVYGKQKPNYWTGSSSANDPLDAEILKGNTLDAFATDGAIVVEVRGWGETRTPSDIVARATAGETVRWEERGYVLEAGPYTFPGNGEKGCSTRVVSGPECGGADPWLFRALRRGSAPTFDEALALALTATPTETAREAA